MTLTHEKRQIDRWSNEILVEKAQRGDKDAERALVTKFYNVCCFEARDSKQHLYDEDTRTGECMMALARAIQTYKEGNGTNFSSYAKTCMRRALTDMARKEVRRPQEVSIDSDVEGSELSMETAFASTNRTDEDASAELVKQALKKSVWDQLSAASKGTGELDKSIIRAVRGLAADMSISGRITASEQAISRMFDSESANVLFILSSSEEGMMMPEQEAKWREELCDMLVEALIDLVIMKSEGYTIEESALDTGLSELVVSRLMQCVKVLAADPVECEDITPTDSEIAAGCVVIKLPKPKPKCHLQGEMMDIMEAA